MRSFLPAPKDAHVILLIDNYDSFVYNLARYVEELGFACAVYRNDAITLDEIRDQLRPTHIILSPGPCTPDEAGICMPLIQQLGPTVPILGVCLGHQAIGQAFGARVVRAQRPLHGMCAPIYHHNRDLFYRLPNPLQVGRYHSLIIARAGFPHEQLQITAISREGEIMALQHHTYPIYGVQFHPESILTARGYELLAAFLGVSYR